MLHDDTHTIFIWYFRSHPDPQWYSLWEKYHWALPLSMNAATHCPKKRMATWSSSCSGNPRIQMVRCVLCSRSAYSVKDLPSTIVVKLFTPLPT